MRVSLSNYGYTALHMFASFNGNHMSMDDAKCLMQTTFRSMLKRGYVAYVRGKGFRITPAGKHALNEFNNTDISRSEGMIGKPLTRYFDPKAYGLEE